MTNYVKKAATEDLLIKIFKNNGTLELDLCYYTQNSRKTFVSMIEEDKRFKIIEYREDLLLITVSIDYNIVSKKELALLLLRS